jgi:redox-sensitive bicupin YhaK (pirin superfamily)
MKTILHTTESRGHAYHGWLDTYHTFSFANYFDPQRVHFGALRVLNDDTIAEGEGFDTHPHDNMEIVTIPLKGAVEHKDSMRNSEVIRTGEIQVMSAGTGIFHSEYSKKGFGDTSLLQIWIFPDKKNVKPRYDKISIADVAVPDTLYQILSPTPDDQGVWIHQNAWFHLGDLSAGWQGEYQLKGKDTGVYLFVIGGEVEVADQLLRHRDGLGVWETDKVAIRVTQPARLLLMEVPMHV